MKGKDYLLGLDIGTTGAKAVLVDGTGVPAAEAFSAYGMSTTRPLWAEQDPEDWWRAAVRCISDVLSQSGAAPGSIAAVGLTGQMHGLVLLDREGAVLRPCILWKDQRSAVQCGILTRAMGRVRILELTGNPLFPGFTAPKVEWVRRHEPGVFGRIRRLLLPKDFIRYRLTGCFASDASDASGTSLFDVGRRNWSDDMVRALDIPREWLPRVTESTELSARVDAAAAAATGLVEGTPVAAGAGDQAAQAIGAGIVSEGHASVTIGTSGVVFAACSEYRRDPAGRLHSFCHAVPGMWHLMGVMLSAGGSLRWYRDTLCEAEKERAARDGADPYEILAADAETAPPGSGGLLFLPYLSGERTPYPDPDARGAFVGLTLSHEKAHMTRAVLEGVAFGLRDSFELIRSLGLNVREIRMTGGGARSALWRRILADTFDSTILHARLVQGAAFGSALIAGGGAGVFPSLTETCERAVRFEQSTAPGPSAALYARQYECYRSLYPALGERFAALGSMSLGGPGEEIKEETADRPAQEKESVDPLPDPPIDTETTGAEE